METEKKIHFELYNVYECGISFIEIVADPFIRLVDISVVTRVDESFGMVGKKFKNLAGKSLNFIK